MRKYLLIISSSLLTVLTAFLITNAVQVGKVVAADEATQKRFESECAIMGYSLNPDSPYTNVDLDVESVMEVYHEKTNTTFNDYISRMMNAQKSSSKTNSTDPNASPPADGICTPDNFSTYCVSERMLMGKATGASDECKSNPALQVDSDGNWCYNGEGYMEYSKSLACRRSALALRAPEESGVFLGTTCLGFAPVLGIAPSEGYSDALILSDEYEQWTKDITQSQIALHMSTCQDGIDREIASSKRALDMTLKAYDELKTAWPLHKRYIEVYDSLVQFRDKMVEIRNHTEAYPSKFIDATTTKCT